MSVTMAERKIAQIQSFIQQQKKAYAAECSPFQYGDVVWYKGSLCWISEVIVQYHGAFRYTLREITKTGKKSLELVCHYVEPKELKKY